MGCKYHQIKCNSQTYTFYFYLFLKESLLYPESEFAYNLPFKRLVITLGLFFLVNCSLSNYLHFTI
jgi:hypothetical protein